MRERMRDAGAHFVSLAPHQGAHRVALRVAVSVAVPLLVLWAIGRLDLSVYASFGAFASLYGRLDGYRDRVRMQLAAGGVQVTAMLLGTTLSVVEAPDTVRVVVVAALAAGVTMIAHAYRWHPPGALFAVFAAGACATLPATARTLAEGVVVGAASAGFAVAVTALIAIVRGGVTAASAPKGRERRSVAAEMAVTVGVGSLLAGIVGLALVGTHWYWAMVAAVAALGGASTTARIVRGAQRLIGTCVGILLAAALLMLPLPPLAVLAVAIALQVCAELFVGRNYGLAMVFITPLALLMIELAVPVDPGPLLRDRLVDTLLGVAVGTAVAVVSATVRRRRAQA
jgi:hypothetical protein